MSSRNAMYANQVATQKQARGVVCYKESENGVTTKKVAERPIQQSSAESPSTSGREAGLPTISNLCQPEIISHLLCCLVQTDRASRLTGGAFCLDKALVSTCSGGGLESRKAICNQATGYVPSITTIYTPFKAHAHVLHVHRKQLVAPECSHASCPCCVLP